MPYRLKLKAGQHVMADKSRPRLDDQGRPTGRFHSVTVNAGGEFDSDVNLASLEPERYDLVGGDAAAQSRRIADLERELAQAKAQMARQGSRVAGDPTPSVAAENPAVAPGGQVSTGYQKSEPVRSSAMLPEEAAKHGANVPPQVLAAAQQAKQQVSFTEAELRGMTVTDLRELAEEEEVDLKGATTKDGIIGAIRSAKGW
jgi:hypothetical protein